MRKIPRLVQLWRSVLVALSLTLMSGGLAQAAELVMFESPGCPYCARWRAEVGPAYAKSEEGKRAPLRSAALPSDPKFKLASPVVVSPTFVLVENGQEVGRIIGYPGADFFWGLLEGLMKKLPVKQSKADGDRNGNLLHLVFARFEAVS